MKEQTRVFVCAVIKNSDGKFLLLKRAKNSRFASGEWEFLSGTIDENETAEECIKREVNEESGLSVVRLERLAIFEFTDHDGRWVAIPFKAEVCNGDILLSHEHSEYSWYDVDEIEEITELKDLQVLWQ